MKKLHDLRSVLSESALLSTTDCMRTKGGSGIRRPRSTGSATTSNEVDTTSEDAFTAETP